MYLGAVLADIQKESAPPKALNAEHLYKLNEAIFNLPEEDTIDEKMSAKLFQAVTKIRQAYNAGKICDNDKNFFYDYVALLGTLQNQHFFSGKQTDKMLAWVREAIDDGSTAAPPAPPEPTGPSKGETKKLKSLEADNQRLKEEFEKLKGISSAVEVLKNFKLSVAEPKGKGKGKGEKKGKGKGKAQDEDEDDDDEEEEEEDGAGKKTKGKGKGKPKEKAKAKAKEGSGKKWKAKESSGTAEAAAA